ncbi:MAG: UDP-N-acetylmuramoyl-L-alanyl-D-glutamate--2,6-diaminopimelate ligase [bacterium]
MMKLTELFTAIEVKEIIGDTNIEISGISYDSRRTRPGHIFVAVTGLVHEGSDFIPEAVNHGARVIVFEKDHVSPPEVTKVIVPSARIALAQLANHFYGYPSEKLNLVGITGTKGKTTVSYLMESIFKTAGSSVGVIGTVESRLDDEIIPAKLTTPESSDLQSLFARMVDKGITHGVMEVTSHALALDRVAGVDFSRAIFTNISYDHGNFHGNKDNYVGAKLKLFRYLDHSSKEDVCGIVNLDDAHAQEFMKATKAPIITYALERKNADITVSDIYTIGLAREMFDISVKGKKLSIETSLIGRFNISNILAAVACGHSFGIDVAVMKEAIERVKAIPGRFEVIDEGQHFLTVVDFAHTPDSLAKLLETVRTYIAGKLVLVFGCQGDNDPMKREMMGSIARGLSNFTFITTDNPKDEDPERIASEIETGMARAGAIEGKDYLKIEGRRTAIKKAMEMMKDGDALVIAGRGHELYQTIKGLKIEFDDREVTRDVLRSKVRV